MQENARVVKLKLGVVVVVTSGSGQIGVPFICLIVWLAQDSILITTCVSDNISFDELPVD